MYDAFVGPCNRGCGVFCLCIVLRFILHTRKDLDAELRSKIITVKHMQREATQQRKCFDVFAETSLALRRGKQSPKQSSKGRARELESKDKSHAKGMKGLSARTEADSRALPGCVAKNPTLPVFRHYLEDYTDGTSNHERMWEFLGVPVAVRATEKVAGGGPVIKLSGTSHHHDHDHKNGGKGKDKNYHHSAGTGR